MPSKDELQIPGDMYPPVVLWLIPSKVLTRKDGSSGVLKRPGALNTRTGLSLSKKTMSAYDTTTQEGTDAELTDFDGRPDDCDCWDADAEHAAERNTLMDHEPDAH